MSDDSADPQPDRTGERLPEFNEIREAGETLRRALRRSPEVSTELADSARRLLEQAIAAGRITWDLAERDELDAIVSRAATVLDGYDDALIEPFSGDLPTFRGLDRDELTELLGGGDAVVGRRLTQLDMTGLDLRDARFLDCAFHRCDLRNCDLAGATILHSVFLECLLEGSSLVGAAITTSLIKGASKDGDQRREYFAGVDARDSNFSGSRIESLQLDGVSFEGAIFSGAYLRRLEATTTTTFAKAIFDLALIEELIVDGVNLREALFIGTDLVNIDFAGTDLRGAVFSSAKLGSCAFAGARLEGTSFRSAYFVAQARFDDAWLDAEFDAPDAESLRRRAGDAGADVPSA